MNDPCQLVQRLELELLEPRVRADRARLDALIADDFTEVGASGRVFGKQEVLTRLPKEQGTRFVVADMQGPQLADGVVLITYRASQGADGAPMSSRRCSIWAQSGEHWQMVYHQGTPD